MRTSSKEEGLIQGYGKNNLSDQIELDEVSAQSKEIRADISQLRQEVKELTKLLKSQTS